MTILGRYCKKCGKIKITDKDAANSKKLVGPFYVDYELDELQREFPELEVFEVDWGEEYIHLK